MVEVILTSFNLNSGFGEGRTKNGGRKVRLRYSDFKTGTQTPKVSPGESVWCVLDGSDGDSLTASEIYNQKSDRMELFLQGFRNHYERLEGLPVNGELLIRKDGSIRRITEVYDATLQPCGHDFFAGRDYSAGYSGSLDSPIPLSSVEKTGQIRSVNFWTWRNFLPEAHNDFTFEVNVRVWREI